MERKIYDSFDEQITDITTDCYFLDVTFEGFYHKRKNKTFTKREFSYLVRKYSIPIEIIKERLGV